MNAFSRLFAVLLISSLAGTAALAQQQRPDQLVKSTTEEMLAVIKKTNDRATLRKIAQQKVLPYFDFTEMTRLAVGRPWREATPEQKKKLQAEFTDLLVNTYTSALTRTVAADKTVEVKPLQAGANDKDVTVRSVVKGGGGQPLEIDYRMSKEDQGWKVIDVIVENVSLVTTYRGSFAQEVQQGGIDGLIKSLEGKNRQLAKG
ncbi:MAG TPA: ABC transporter substrate-binding protein [Burkholderiales bacterium]|nr:ABC transporter substrate-binding protein [Burkholderiales bacterium]